MERKEKQTGFKIGSRDYVTALCGKGNKAGLAIKLAFSLLFAFMAMLSSLIVFDGTVFARLDKTYFRPMSLGALGIFMAALIASYCIICLLEVVFANLEQKMQPGRTCVKRVYFWIFTAVLLLCWMPYYLSYFPGGVYSDTFNSIYQIQGTLPLTNHHPIVYTMMLKVAIKIGSLLGRGLQFSMGLFTLGQCIAMAMTLACFLYWIYKKGIAKLFIILATLFFALFPLIPYYAISVWKDTPFVLALFLYSLYMLEIATTDAECLNGWKGISTYAVLSIAVSFLRNNGFYIVLLMTFILFIVYRKRIRKTLKRFAILSMAVLVCIYGIQGPVFSALGWNENKTVESYGCLIQQIAYVVSTDGTLSREEQDFMGQVMPLEAMKKTYRPCNVDMIKWHEEFDKDFLNTHKGEFLRVWAGIAAKNPGKVLQAHLLSTLGFWDVTKATKTAYIQKDLWFDTEMMHEVDYFQRIFGFSFDRLVAPEHPISSAVFVWFALMSLALAAARKKWRLVLVYLPAVLLWGTVMVAAPIAFSLRYVYIFVPFVPMATLLPMLSYEKKNREMGKDRTDQEIAS